MIIGNAISPYKTKRVLSNVLGNIMQNDYTGGNWTAEGVATFTNNGSSIAMSGGGAITDLYYYNAYSTCLENISWSATATIDNLTAGGFGVGLRSRNAYFGGGIGRGACVQLQVAGPDSGKLKFYSGSTLIQTSTSVLSFNIGDQIKLTYEFVGDTWYFYAENLTTSQLITDSYQFTDYTLPESLPYLTNTCSPCLWTFGGSQTVVAFSLSSQQQKGVDVVVVGDSKAKGYYSGSFANRFCSLAGFTSNSGGGDGVIHAELRLPELLKIRPKNVVLYIGCNDVRAGTTDAVWQAAYNNVVTTLTNAGITVWNCLPTPETLIDFTALKNWIQANQTNIIDLWTPFLTGASGIKSYYTPDNIHPNSDAQALIANIIKYELGISAIDPYAQTYADRISLGATETQYIDTFVKGLKSDGLWTKMTAVYPFMGASATNHKWNLKEPADADGAYRLTFNGGWTHNYNGIVGNGINTYINTNIIPSHIFTLNSTHLSIYSKTQSNGNYLDFGCCSNSSIHFLSLYANYGNNFSVRLNQTIPSDKSNISSLGFFLGSRISSNSLFSKINNNISTNFTTISTTLPSTNLYIGDLNLNGNNLGFYTNRNYAFASIGDGLTDTDASNLYNIVQAYQIKLGRQV